LLEKHKHTSDSAPVMGLRTVAIGLAGSGRQRRGAKISRRFCPSGVSPLPGSFSEAGEDPGERGGNPVRATGRGQREMRLRLGWGISARRRQGMRHLLVTGGGFLMRQVVPAAPKNGSEVIAPRGGGRNPDARLGCLVGGHSRRQEGKERAGQRR